MLGRLVVLAMLATTWTLPWVGPAPAGAWRSQPLGDGIVVTQVPVAVSDEGVSGASSGGVAVPAGATVAVVSWTGSAEVTLVAQVLDGAGTVLATDPALHAGGDGADEGAVRSRWGGTPMWLPPGSAGLRILDRRGDARDIRVDFLTVADPPSPDVTAAASVDTATLPPIRPTEAWGNPGWVYHNEDCDLGPNVPGYLDRAAVHHTVNSNTYPASAVDDLLIGIYYLHTNINGWCDIGYNFIIDRFGVIWEGRRDSIEKPVQGGHTSGINPGSVGFALLGTHHPGLAYGAAQPRPDSAAQIAAIISAKFSEAGADPTARVHVGVDNDEYVLHGQRLVVPAIYGHREVEATSCPGDLAIGLVDEIRDLVTVTTPAHPTVLINNHHRDGPAQVVGTVDLGDHDLLVGDWNGDGFETFGYYRAPYFHLWNSMSSPRPDLVVKYGRPGDTALVGDWDGDGIDTVGIRRANVLHLRNSNDPGPAHHYFSFGRRHDEVLIGDWDGDGVDTVGTRRGNVIYLNNGFHSGEADITYGYGRANDDVVVGDWDGDRRDTLGVRRGATLFLGNRTLSGPADLVYDYAGAADHIEYGDWNGDWITTPLVVVDPDA